MNQIQTIEARIAQMTAEMNKLRRANGTLPSLASNQGKQYAVIEFAREEAKHELAQARRVSVIA